MWGYVVMGVLASWALTVALLGAVWLRDEFRFRAALTSMLSEVRALVRRVKEQGRAGQ